MPHDPAGDAHVPDAGAPPGPDGSGRRGRSAAAGPVPDDATQAVDEGAADERGGAPGGAMPVADAAADADHDGHDAAHADHDGHDGHDDHDAYGYGDDGDEEDDGRHTALPPSVERWRQRSASGAVMSAVALGLGQVFQPERQKPAIIAEAPGDPYDEDDPVTVDYVADDAEGTTVHVRPWLFDREPGG